MVIIVVERYQFIISALAERRLVLDMLKAGNNKEKRIQRAAEELLQPNALPDVQDWLTKISNKGNYQLCHQSLLYLFSAH